MTAFNVKAVAALIGISPHTLRAWERRYHAISPARNSSGRRSYTEQEIERLKLLAALTARGHSIGTIASETTAKLEKLLHGSPYASNETAPEGVIRPIVERLIAALRHYQIREVAYELEWARASLGCRDLVLQVIAPLIAEVGRLVMNQEVSIAQEHALSSVIRDQIGQILQLLQNHRPPLGANPTNKLLLTTPEGDLHEFGILLGAALCANYGISAHYLGPNLPATALVDAANALQTNLIILGNSPIPKERRAEPLPRYLQTLDQGLNPRVKVWIGGQGELPDLNKGYSLGRFHYLGSLKELDERLKALGISTTTK